MIKHATSPILILLSLPLSLLLPQKVESAKLHQKEIFDTRQGIDWLKSCENMKAIKFRFASTLVLILLESLLLAEPTSDTAYDSRPKDIRGGLARFDWLG